MNRLFRPGRVAAIGGAAAERVVAQLDGFGFAGSVWPVHPSRAEVGGRPAYRTVADLPGVPDAAFVAVPAAAVPPIVAALRDAGCGGVVVYSSGFAEAGEIQLQRDLIEAARPMPMLGPNCYGYVNAFDGTAIWPDVHGLVPVEAGVAIVSQSGNIALNLTMARRGLEIGLVVTAGNQAGLDVADLVDLAGADPRVTAVGLQFEGAFDGSMLAQALQRSARRRKPVVVLKMGSSELGAVASASHTGSLTGDDDAWDALFERYGAGRVRTIPAFLEALKLAPVVPPAPRVLSLSASGGEAAHVADLAAGLGVELPPIVGDHATAVRATVDERVAVANPMDYHTFSWGDEERIRRTFAAAAAGPFDVALLVLDFPRVGAADDWWAACRAFAAACGDLPGLVVASLPETMPGLVLDRIAALGLVPMLGVAETLEALAALRRPVAGATPLRLARRFRETVTLDEAGSKLVLSGAGVPVPAWSVAADPLVAPVVYPVTVKVLGVTHKAAVGGVAVGVPDEQALRKVLAAMPVAEGYLLEETIHGGLAELLLSVRSVPPLGWLLTVGAGGVDVEARDDRAHLLLPVTAAEVEDALASLRMRARKRRADVAAAVRVALALGALIESDERIVEVEINPLIVRADGAVAADAMVTVRREETRPRALDR